MSILTTKWKKIMSLNFFFGKKISFRSVTQINAMPHPIKIDLDKKLDPKQKTIQTFNIDAQRFRKAKNENPWMWEIGVAG